MNKRPHIPIELSGFDRIMEAIGVSFLVVIWVWVIYFYPELPDKIPTHFNASGEADDFGTKINLFILPVLATVLYFVLLLISRKPRLYNYPVSVEPGNLKLLYQLGSRTVRWIALFIVIIFGIIIYSTIQTARGQMEGIGKWFLPFAIIGATAPTIVMMVKLSRMKSVNKSNS